MNTLMTNNHEHALLHLYQAIERAETRDEVKYLLKQIQALQKAQRAND